MRLHHLKILGTYVEMLFCSFLFSLSFIIILFLFACTQPREEEEKGLSAMEVITQHTRSIASTSGSLDGSAKDKFCVFFDESRGIDCNVSCML